MGNLRRAIGSFSAAAAAALGFGQYTIEDVGSFGGGTSIAFGVSENGWVTGNAQAGANERAFRWQSGAAIQNLGSLGGAISVGRGVNSAGTVAGMSYTGGGVEFHAFRWTSGSGMVDIHTTGTFSEANGINDSGTIVGTENFRAFRQPTAGARLVLPTLGGITTGLAINESGQIVGGSDDSGGIRHPYRYTDGIGLVDLGIPFGHQSASALGLNNPGSVVGYSTPTGSTYHAWVWHEGAGFTALAGLFSYDTRARDINDAGFIVGSSWLSDSGATSQAVMWLPGSSSPVNLNSLLPVGSGWILRNAYAINNAGQIVGVGEHNGISRGFLMTPVPEPASLAALAAGGTLLLRRRRRS